MKKVTQIVWVMLCCITFNQVSAQTDFSALFRKAYETNPKVPYPALEVLAYAQSRINNVEPQADMDHHHGPTHYGLFGLVENGEGFFRNTLSEVATIAKADINLLKTDAATQINAIAKVFSEKIGTKKITTVQEIAEVFQSFFEAPQKTKIDVFAKNQFLYEIYYDLQNGFSANGVTVAPMVFDASKWFTTENFKVLCAKRVLIHDETITNGTEVFRVTPSTTNIGTISTGINTATLALVVDYPGALWVASPNYSSRAGTAITAVAIHTMQGSYSGSISWFQNTASNVSAHYMVRSSDGQITQMVREINKAWHIGTANPYTVGIEHEGKVEETCWYTTAMYNASADLTKDICNRNGIDKTTCYNGPSSLGSNVLSTTIKIKGHQHYPSQTHTDPGINWNWPLFYNLINPPTCNATTVLNESYIGTNAVNLNWAAVTGVVSYTVQWKLSTATTWSSASSINNYYTVTGLAASTAYNWRIVTNCIVGISTSATQAFTTKASCYDAYENNNSYLAPTIYPALNGGYVYGKVCASGDVDFFKITTTSTNNINITLANLPKNYNVETFTAAGVYLDGSYNTGTTSETLTLFSKAAGSYLVKVYGATATDNDALSDYRLNITTSVPTVARTTDIVGSINLVPNPTYSSTTLSIDNSTASYISVVVKDIYGVNRYTKNYYANVGKQNILLQVSMLKEGVYIVQVQNKNGVIESKQLIIQR